MQYFMHTMHNKAWYNTISRILLLYNYLSKSVE